MKERDAVAQWMLKLRKIPNSWWYKIPDVRICGNCGKVATSDKRPFDVIGCYDQTSFAIEFKMDKGKLSPHQSAQLYLHSRSGGVALLVTIVDGDELVALMDRYGVLITQKEGLINFITDGIY